MLPRPALLAIVFLWTLALFHDAHASSMLPYGTPVAQDEQSPSVLGLRVWDIFKGLTKWRAWVVLVAADAACDFFFVYCLLIGVFDGLFILRGAVVLQCQLRPLATSGWLANVFRGQRTRGC